MPNYALSQRAEPDIEDILDYITQDDLYSAVAFYESLERLLQQALDIV